MLQGTQGTPKIREVQIQIREGLLDGNRSETDAQKHGKTQVKGKKNTKNPLG